MPEIKPKQMQKIARIVSIDSSGLLDCEIDCGTACSGCAMRKACNPESSVRRITLLNTLGGLEVGDSIEVEVSSSMGMRAIFFAYMLPVLLLVLSMCLLVYFGASELVQGLSALGVLLVYFVCVRVFGIGSGVSIEIVKKI